MPLRQRLGSNGGPTIRIDLCRPRSTDPFTCSGFPPPFSHRNAFARSALARIFRTISTPGQAKRGPARRSSRWLLGLSGHPSPDEERQNRAPDGRAADCRRGHSKTVLNEAVLFPQCGKAVDATRIILNSATRKPTGKFCQPPRWLKPLKTKLRRNSWNYGSVRPPEPERAGHPFAVGSRRLPVVQ